MMSTRKAAVPAGSCKVARKLLAMAIAGAVGAMPTLALAQATTGTIFGQAPVGSNETVQVIGGAGFNRVVPVDKAGRYTVTMPIGTYTVNLLRDGKVIQTRPNVTPLAAGATQLDFAAAAATGGEAADANAKELAAVTVHGSQLPAIDVNSTMENNVITAQQLQQLPLARTSAGIALLAPGVVAGSAALGGGPTGEPVVSFGGSSIAENAYYVNGFNTTNPLTDTGGITLPYGSISQQQTITSGYGAEYGRSAGGVISQIGMSGTNEWHFGGQMLWQPASLQGTEGNWHYANPLSKTPGQQPGNINAYRNDNKETEKVYDLYLGGPLIKDKLFFFISAEAEQIYSNSVSAISSNPTETYAKTKFPKTYGKLDWNINDSNTLSLTYLRSGDQYSGITDTYNYTTHQAEQYSSTPTATRTTFNLWSGQYTSYITDNLTFNAMYGVMKGTYYSNVIDPASPYVGGGSSQNPAFTGGQAGGISNPGNTIGYTYGNPAHKSDDTNLRLDFTWKLGDHTLKFGIDNQNTADTDDGSIMTGPGYAWIYGQSDPAQPIDSAQGYGTKGYVDAPGSYPNGAQGYNVSKYIYVTDASVRVSQRAQYVQDDWQVTPNLLLNLGIRNDQFTNYNPDAVPYLRLTSPQWAPRLGFSWNVFGDSSLKIFGNVGRYYLDMPSSVALREASASTYTQQYFTYSGIDSSTGFPIGLTPIYSNPASGVSTNNEYGQVLDPNTVRAQNLKAEYQDEFVLGFQQQIGPHWNYGVTGTVNRLGRIIDDTGDEPTICNYLQAQNPNVPGVNCGNIQGSILINPGTTNTYVVANDNGGYNYAKISPAEMGFPKVIRNYYGLRLFLDHPWDGKWAGNISYVFSRSIGSTDGPVEASVGQGGSSYGATTQWDYGQLMQYSNGDQSNEHKHVLTAYGSYQLFPEWLVGAVVKIASGAPKDCLGYYGPDQTNPGLSYGSYHWCGGVPTPPGSTGFTPWTHTLDLSLQYRPRWADKKLAFSLQVLNVFNEQKVTQFQAGYGQTVAPKPAYLLPYGMENPRYVRMSVSYDW